MPAPLISQGWWFRRFVKTFQSAFIRLRMGRHPGHSLSLGFAPFIHQILRRLQCPLLADAGLDELVKIVRLIVDPHQVRIPFAAMVVNRECVNVIVGNNKERNRFFARR